MKLFYFMCLGLFGCSEFISAFYEIDLINVRGIDVDAEVAIEMGVLKDDGVDMNRLRLDQGGINQGGTMPRVDMVLEEDHGKTEPEADMKIYEVDMQISEVDMKISEADMKMSEADMKISEADMLLVGICGDGLLQIGEACDDGNLVNGDSCSSTCTTEVPQCVNDMFEPNNNTETASVLNNADQFNAQICLADDDWYTVSLCAGGTLTIIVSLTPANGDIDVRLNDASQVLLTSSVGITGTEVVTYTNISTTDMKIVYAKVYGFAHSVNNSYSISVTITNCTDL